MHVDNDPVADGRINSRNRPFPIDTDRRSVEGSVRVRSDPADVKIVSYCRSLRDSPQEDHAGRYEGRRGPHGRRPEHDRPALLWGSLKEQACLSNECQRLPSVKRPQELSSHS